MCCIMAVTVSVDNKNLSTCMQLMIQVVLDIVEAHCSVIREQKSLLSNSRNIDVV